MAKKQKNIDICQNGNYNKDKLLQRGKTNGKKRLVNPKKKREGNVSA